MWFWERFFFKMTSLDTSPARTGHLQESASECFQQSSRWRPWWSSSAWASRSYWTASWTGLHRTSSLGASFPAHRAEVLSPHSQLARTSSSILQSLQAVSSGQIWRQCGQVSVREKPILLATPIQSSSSTKSSSLSFPQLYQEAPLWEWDLNWEVRIRVGPSWKPRPQCSCIPWFSVLLSYSLGAALNLFK